MNQLSPYGSRENRVHQFELTYLRARWVLGLSLIVLSGFVVVVGIDLSHGWVIAAAGAVILAHNFAMKMWDIGDAAAALMVDLTAALIASLVIGHANHDQTPAMLTMVGASVLIALFSDAWARIGVAAYVTSFTFASLIAIEDGTVSAAFEGFVGAVFVSALVIAAISAIRARLVEVEAGRAQMLGVVSHELRNHLAGVVGAISLIREAGSDLAPEDIDELLQLSHGQAVEATDVIEDLLVASRAERGVLDAIPEVVDLCPDTETVIRRTSLKAGEITYDFSDGPMWALVDPLRYKQIIRNLLTNALRYGGDTIRVSIERRGAVASVVVADDGEGVAPAHESAIFQPYRGGKAIRAVSGSSGLGLWIARSLARKMDGELIYRRREGQTVFELTLPAADEPSSSDDTHLDHSEHASSLH